MATPLITVIMPVYNREKFIGDAIQSIINQSFENFELIIINDASIDNTKKIILKFPDSRIILLENEKNIGVAASRNKGIEKAKGKFIAFMDSDDISLPNRLQEQLNKLMSDSGLIGCGSWLKILNSSKVIKHCEHHNDIITRLLIHCSLSIGAAMLKTSVVKQVKFNPTLKFGEDYEFWSRVCWMGSLYNIPEPFLLYRSHKDQISINNKKEQLNMDVDIRMSLFKKINYSRNEFPDSLIRKFLLFDEYVQIEEFSRFIKWLNYIKEQNRKLLIFPLVEFDKTIEEIRRSLLNNIYYKKNNIGLSKFWRIKSLIFLRQQEMLEVILKKIM
jgi:glycosyltransferase involved in cell wall biosynthesis